MMGMDGYKYELAFKERNIWCNIRMGVPIEKWSMAEVRAVFSTSAVNF